MHHPRGAIPYGFISAVVPDTVGFHHQYVRGSANFPAMAVAAAVAGEPR